MGMPELAIVRIACWAALISCIACGASRPERDRAQADNAGSGGFLQASGGAGGRAVIEASANGGDSPGCRRDVAFANVIVNEPQPFDLVIVADDSGSIAWSHRELAAGLGELLTNVRGRSVRIFVLTPTQYGASSAAARVPLTGASLVAWQNPANDEAYGGAVTDYQQSCLDPKGLPITCPNPTGPDAYRVSGHWSLSMPPPVAALRPDMSDDEFSQQQRAVSDKILGLSGTGSPHEQPLCTLARYAAQGAAVLPRNVVFLVISDEDDVSVPDDCLAGFNGELRVSNKEQASTACTANCDTYRYRMTGSYAEEGFPYVCAALDDLGHPVAGTEHSGWVSQGAVPTCDGFASGTCTAEEKRQIAPFCPSGATLTSCSRACQLTARTCTVDLHDPTVNPCNGTFGLDGVMYDGLAKYCANQGSDWHDCRGGGLNIEYASSMSGTSSRQPLMPGATTADVGSYFRTMADGVFTAHGYLLEAIIFDPAFACTLGTGQSYGANLAKIVGDRTNIFPICEPYARALSGVSAYAQALIQTSFALDLAGDEQVTAVIVVAKDGSRRELDSTAYHYDKGAMNLSIDIASLTGGDANLAVEVTSDCRPVVK